MTLTPGTDLFPLLGGMLAAVTCGVLGNVLVLRRLSLMGDAISHSVLPGLVIAFLVTSTRSPWAMFAGAAIAGVVTVVLVEVVKTLGRVESGAAMGVVFSVMFAIGVLLIEQAARQVDLDADCVLHGDLEALVWYDAPGSFAGIFSWSTLRAVPREIIVLFGMCTIAFTFITLFFKELRIATFDPALATTLGFHAGGLHYASMILVAAATVASFEAVGSILVIAMLVCPASTARLLTDRLRSQIIVSVIVALLAAVLGYLAATVVPSWFGKDAVRAAGSIAVMSGVLLAVTITISPTHGVIGRIVRRRRLSLGIAVDDVLAALYRQEERGGERLTPGRLAELLPMHPTHRAIRLAAKREWVERDEKGLQLTGVGRDKATDLIRRHRLWEQYLVAEAGVPVDHVHETAEQLEHVAVRPPEGPTIDPHGRRIPSRDGDGNGPAPTTGV